MAVHEIYTEEEFQQIKKELYKKRVRGNLERVFDVYNYNKDIIFTDIASKMVNSSSDGQPKPPYGFNNQLETLVAQKVDAEEYCDFIDELMDELDEVSYNIIELVYIDRECTNEEIFGDILEIPKMTFYRKKWKAEDKMYRILRKNQLFFEKWY